MIGTISVTDDLLNFVQISRNHPLMKKCRQLLLKIRSLISSNPMVTKFSTFERLWWNSFQEKCSFRVSVTDMGLFAIYWDQPCTEFKGFESYFLDGWLMFLIPEIKKTRTFRLQLLDDLICYTCSIITFTWNST